MRSLTILGASFVLVTASAVASTPASRMERVTANPLLPGLRLQQPGAMGASVGPEPSTRKRYVLPVLLSAAVPGAGEIATGHWLRGLPLVAADVATWLGYAHFQQEGRDWRTSYERFGDKYWHYTGDANGNGQFDAGEIKGWQENLREYYDGQNGEAYDWYDPGAAYNCTCPFIPKEEDRQHYYENIGKYRYYWMGWEDWLPSEDFRNSDSQGLRRQYDDMRIRSNNNFDRSTQMIVVGMATRLASVVQTVFLVRGDLRRDLQVRPLRLSGRGGGLELTYKY